MKKRPCLIYKWVASKFLPIIFLVGGMLFSGAVLAQSTDSIGTIASNITGSFEDIGKLLLAVSFLGGLGFIMAAIFKFKQHKDNPSQIPLGTPLMMLLIGVILVFLANLVGPAGTTIFGKSATPGGFTGAGVTKLPGGGGASTP